jgi:hypothetical protein
MNRVDVDHAAAVSALIDIRVNATFPCREPNQMPTTPHIEKHFTGSATLRDVVIGMAEGLTVPFAVGGLAAAAAYYLAQLFG